MSKLKLEAVELSPGDFLFSSRRELRPGGFARVFAIKYRGEEVAVKVPQAMDSTAEEKEIANLTTVAHRNIVQFYGKVRYDNRVCLVFELAPKGSVRDLLEKGPLQLLQTSRQSWILDIARAVKYMHSEAPVQLVHGDIKGGNVLVFDDPAGGTLAKVSDFGQSRPLMDTTSVRHMGTLLWTAPEVLSEEAHSQRSDQWAFACTVIELMSERQPYHHVHQGERRGIKRVLRQVEDHELDPLSGLQVTWPPRLLQVVRQCLELNHRHRPTMESVLRTLTSEEGAVGGGEERKSSDQPAPAQSARSPLPRPEKLHFSSFSPSGSAEERILNLRTEETFLEVRTSATRLFSEVPPGPRSIFFSQEGRHLRGGELRSHILCYDPDSSSFFFVDLQDGRHVEKERRTVIIMRFLGDRSDLPRSPRLHPCVIIWNDTQVLQMDGGRIEAAPQEALWQERFFVFLFGIKCGTAQPKFFWRITRRGETDRVFASPEGGIVMGEEAIPGLQKNYFLLLLRSGDRLPTVSLPEGRFLDVRHRLGATVTVTDGRIQASPAPFPADKERWEAPVGISDLDKAISSAASN